MLSAAGQARRRKRRKAGARAAGDTAETPAPRPRATSRGALEGLELLIDRCLAIAREHEESLENVARHLREARNGVVLKLGQSAASRA